MMAKSRVKEDKTPEFIRSIPNTPVGKELSRIFKDRNYNWSDNRSGDDYEGSRLDDTKCYEENDDIDRNRYKINKSCMTMNYHHKSIDRIAKAYLFELSAERMQAKIDELSEYKKKYEELTKKINNSKNLLNDIMSRPDES